MAPIDSPRPDARLAAHDDIPEVVRMYGELEREQSAIRVIWPDADGLPHPWGHTIRDLIDAEDATVVVGLIDDVLLGFLIATEDTLVASRSEDRIGAVRYIFTEFEARGVGVGDAMLTVAEEALKGRGVDLFDAYVSPGHRLAKNFFESHGFKARAITMHRSDRDAEDGAQR